MEINEQVIQEAVKAEPEVGESYNVKTSAYVDAHGGTGLLEYYDYINLSAEYMALLYKCGDSERVNEILKRKYGKDIGKCALCGTPIIHHYFTRFPDGILKPLGCECVEQATGFQAGDACKKASQKAMRDTVKRRKARAVKRMMTEWFEEQAFTDEHMDKLHEYIHHYKKLCPYPTNAEFNDRREREIWENGEELKQLKVFIEKHKDCSEFMYSCHMHPTYNRNQAVKRNGCRTCRKKFKPVIGKKPTPEHFRECKLNWKEPVNDKDAIIEEGKRTGCPNPGGCIEPVIYEAKLRWMKDAIDKMQKYGSYTYYTAVKNAEYLRKVGIDVPKFEEVKPDPLDEEEKEELRKKVNKEIQKASVMTAKYHKKSMLLN